MTDAIASMVGGEMVGEYQLPSRTGPKTEKAKLIK
jgi:hypothetical protein